MIAPDDTTFAYLEGRPAAPRGADWERALERWSELRTDDDAVFDHEVEIDVAELEPQVTWGTNLGMVAPIGGTVPDPATIVDPDERAAIQRALAYMALEPGRSGDSHRPRLHRLVYERPHRGSARGRSRGGRHRVDARVTAMVVPGSATVKRQAEDEGLDRVFERGIRVAQRRLLDVPR